MEKVIITVVGKDTVGIIARTCTYLSNENVNILDISQTIVSGYFNMMMIVDISGMKDSWRLLFQDLTISEKRSEYQSSVRKKRYST